jgi:hypothetical protein
MDFERWFKERTSLIERILLTSAAVLLGVLLLSQALLTQPAIRRMFSLVDRLEGNPYEPVEPQMPVSVPLQASQEPHYLELRVASGDASALEIRVNGETITTFGSNNTVIVEVHDGDEVEVGGEATAQEVEIQVTKVSEGIVTPAQGKTVTFYGPPETVSYVVVGSNR